MPWSSWSFPAAPSEVIAWRLQEKLCFLQQAQHPQRINHHSALLCCSWSSISWLSQVHSCWFLLRSQSLTYSTCWPAAWLDQVSHSGTKSSLERYFFPLQRILSVSRRQWRNGRAWTLGPLIEAKHFQVQSSSVLLWMWWEFQNPTHLLRFVSLYGLFPI